MSDDVTECSIATVVMEIVSRSRNEQEVAYGIYERIAKNIKYMDNSIRTLENMPVPGSVEWKEVNKPENVLKNRVATYDGFAALFQKMAEIAGLESIITHGYNRVPDERRFPDGDAALRPHAWNIVKINGSWRIIDTVQGSGDISFRLSSRDDGTLFESIGHIPRYNSFFFMPDPESMKFINFPNEQRWQLTQDTLTKNQFINQPTKGALFFESDTELISHTNGTIKVTKAQAETLEIRIRETAGRLFSANLISYPTNKFLATSYTSSKTWILPNEEYKIRNFSLKREGDYVLIRPNILRPGRYALAIRAQTRTGFGHTWPLVEYMLVIE